MFRSTDKILVLGRSGCGKSYLTRSISSAYPRRIIFDTLSEYSDSDGVLCHDFSDFGRKILETEKSENFTLIYQFDIEQADSTQEFNEALRILYYRGNVFICIEEVQNYSTPHSMPQWLKQCLLTGRHRNIGLIFTTQRPGECHKTIVSQAAHVFCGSLHERNDIEYTRSVLNERAYDLINLPEREFIYFRPGQKIEIINNNFKIKKPVPKKSEPASRTIKETQDSLPTENQIDNSGSSSQNLG